MNERTRIKRIMQIIMVIILLFHSIEFFIGGNENWLYLIDNAVTVVSLLLIIYIYRKTLHSKLTSELQLRSVLDTAAEGIYGIDAEGKCTFVNRSCLEILGYESEDELLGNNMHDLIHHSKEDGAFYPKEECEIIQQVNLGKFVHNDQEVFWRKNGTSFYAEFRSKPQWSGNRVIGSVVSFADITERKHQEEELRYLTFHDPVTGLFNKVFAYEEIARLNVERNLPFSIIVGDVNGLKLANDVFGHDAGDALLQDIAQTIKRAVRSDDIVARTGGDEFLILLPKTTEEDAERLLRRILYEVKNRTRDTISSISLGTATKMKKEEDFHARIKEAEEKMYQYKSLHHSKNQRSTLDKIMDTLFEKSPKEKEHAERMSLLSERIATAMNLPYEEIRRVKEAAYFHDIGKIALDEETLNKLCYLQGNEYEEMKRHTVIGYRILNLFSDTMDLARGALEHHELYDGSGYPKQLKGEEISLMGRILSVAEAYEFYARWASPDHMTEESAVRFIENQKGRKFDEKVVLAFLEIMRPAVTEEKLEDVFI